MNTAPSRHYDTERSEVVAAYQALTRRVIVEAFQCTAEEALWLNHRLTHTFSPLIECPLGALSAVVRHELVTGQAELYLRQIEAGTLILTPQPAHQDSTLTTPQLADWVSALMQQLRHIWTITAGQDLAITANLSATLSDLGVADDNHPRQCSFVPMDVRSVMAKRPRATPVIRSS